MALKIVPDEKFDNVQIRINVNEDVFKRLTLFMEYTNQKFKNKPKQQFNDIKEFCAKILEVSLDDDKEFERWLEGKDVVPVTVKGKENGAVNGIARG